VCHKAEETLAPVPRSDYWHRPAIRSLARDRQSVILAQAGIRAEPTACCFKRHATALASIDITRPQQEICIPFRMFSSSKTHKDT